MYVLKRFLGLALFALSSPLFMASAHADADPPALLVAPPPSPAMQYVRDLLVLDAAAALKAEADKAGLDNPRRLSQPAYPLSSATNGQSFQVEGKAGEVDAAPPRYAAIRLTAILGVGSRLSALLDVNGQEVVYRSGRAAPVAGPDTGLRLVKIATPCVEILLDDGQSDTRCIHEVHP